MKTIPHALRLSGTEAYNHTADKRFLMSWNPQSPANKSRIGYWMKRNAEDAESAEKDAEIFGFMKTKDELNQLSGVIIDAAMEVHREFGPGLLERVYEAALQILLLRDGIKRHVINFPQ